MTASPNTVFLAWLCPETRAIVPVGRLVERALDDYEFAYIQSVKRAQLLGFEALLSFPDLAAVYRSTELPALFHNRVMRSSRPDYPAFVTELGLEANAGPLALMARSGGRRQTDELEVFALPGRAADGTLRTHVLARGVRHVSHAEDEIRSLVVGDPLFVLRDLQNPVGPHALALRTKRQGLVGYLPDYLARELAATADDVVARLVVQVERVNLDPVPVHHRLLCRVDFPTDLRLFESEEYRPLASSSDAAA